MARGGSPGHLSDAAPVGSRSSSAIARRATCEVVSVGPSHGALHEPVGGGRILPPLVFGLGVLLAPAASRPLATTSFDTCAFPVFLASGRGARSEPLKPLSNSWSTGSRSGAATYWSEYLGGPAGRIGAAGAVACVPVSRSAPTASLSCMPRACALEGLRGPVTVLRGLHAERARVAARSRKPGTAGGAVRGPSDSGEAGRRWRWRRDRAGAPKVWIPGLRGDDSSATGPERALLERRHRRTHGVAGIVTRRPGFAAGRDARDGDAQSAMCMLLTSRAARDTAWL